MNFAQLHESLRLEILRRIERGELSGKLLSYKTGYKQAHISNFLNRRRMLSMEAMDSMLASLNLDLADLLPGGLANPLSQVRSLQTAKTVETVPLVSQATAILNRQIARSDVVAWVPLMPGTLDHFPTRSASLRRDWERFVAIRVTAAQAAEMQPVLRPHAILLLDRHYISLTRLPGEMPALYAVNTGSGLAIRYVTMKFNRLIMRCYSYAQPVSLLEPPAGLSAVELIVGRVCQIVAPL